MQDPAVAGYAQGGYAEQVSALIAQGADQEAALIGYAIGGYIEQVKILIAQDASRYIYGAVKYCALGDFSAAVNCLIAQGADQLSALAGYAQGGHVAQVNAFIAKNTRILGMDRIIETVAIKGYARGGHVAAVNTFIVKDPSNKNVAVEGYARGGHVAQVNTLIAQGANKTAAADGYVLRLYPAPKKMLLDLLRATDNTDLIRMLNSRVASADYLSSQELEALIADKKDSKAAIEKQLKDFALGGYVAAVNILVARGVDKEVAVSGYWQGGHLATKRALNALLLKTEIPDLVRKLNSRALSNVRLSSEFLEQLIANKKNRKTPIEKQFKEFTLGCDMAAKNTLLGNEKSSHGVPLKYLLGSHLASTQDAAVLGYALCGDVDAVNALIALGASQEAAVLGYAQGGHITAMNTLIAQGADRHVAVRGCALGGHTAAVDDLIAKGAYKDAAIAGYAKGGRIKEADTLIFEQGSDQNAAIVGYAMGDRTMELNVLAAREGSDLNVAAAWCALGGYFMTMSILVDHGADINVAVRACAQGGYFAEVDALIAQGADKSEAVQGYAIGGHFAEVDALIAQGADPKVAVAGYKQGGHLAAKIARDALLITTVNDDLVRELQRYPADISSTVFFKKPQETDDFHAPAPARR